MMVFLSVGPRGWGHVQLGFYLRPLKGDDKVTWCAKEQAFVSHPKTSTGAKGNTMVTENQFTTEIVWTGNTGVGTKSYRAYDRTWNVAVPGKPVIPCSNDPELGGEPTLMNPEDMLLSALAGCHMLWYLHLASDAGIVVTAYRDAPLGIGETTPDGAGRFVKAILRPRITVEAGADLAKANAIHADIHKVCFIARSVAFPVEIKAKFQIC